MFGDDTPSVKKYTIIFTFVDIDVRKGRGRKWNHRIHDGGHSCYRNQRKDQKQWPKGI